MQDQDSSYEEIKEALLGFTAMSFSSAAEDFCMAERGRLTKLEPRLAIEKMTKLVDKITKAAADVLEAGELMVVATTRNWLVPPLKTYVNMSKSFGLQNFVRTIEEWERSQPAGTPWFKDNSPIQQQPGSLRYSSHLYKKSINCFHCGKAGHVSHECCSRIASEKQSMPNSFQRPSLPSEPKIPS